LIVVVLPDPATVYAVIEEHDLADVGRGERVDTDAETEYCPVIGAEGTRVSGTPVARNVTPWSSLNVAPLATVIWNGVVGIGTLTSPTIDSVLPVAFVWPKKMSFSIAPLMLAAFALPEILPWPRAIVSGNWLCPKSSFRLKLMSSETSWSAANFRGTSTPPERIRPKRLPEPN
jgi:hypothetical protein